MTHEALEKLFVQRHQLARQLVELTSESALTSAKHYTLLIGPRGIGKTHLVSLIYHRLRKLESLKDCLLIAWLREEEWGVTSFVDLVLSILKALQREYSSSQLLGEQSEIPPPPPLTRGELKDTRLAERIEAIYSSPETAEQDAQALLVEIIGTRTLLLLVENLNDIFEGLGEPGQKQFRGFLQQTDRCTMIATAQSLFNGVKLRQFPFHGFFRIRYLEDLRVEDAVQLLANIAQLNGNAELESYIKTPNGRARIQAVHLLAGGNHRIYVVFSKFLTRKSLDELVAPFMGMLDDLTPYYQERMKWLVPQQRKIVEFLSDVRQAVSVAEVSGRCLMVEGMAKSELKELREKGYVSSEDVEGESFYELREPLMRFCLEVKKQRGEPIGLFVEFLRIWYTPKELQQRLELLPDRGQEREYVLQALREKDDSPLMKVYLKDYESYFDKDDFVSALQVAEELVAIRGEAQDWAKQGRCLRNLERYEEALVSLDKAIELDPNSVWVWGERGWSLNQLERYQEALASLDKAIELDPTSAKPWVLQSIVLNRLERYEEALASLDKAIELDPSDAFAWSQRGEDLRYNFKCYEEALASFDKAIELQPNSNYASRYWANRGIVLQNLKRYEEALASLDKAIELDPNHAYAWAWLHRGFVLSQFKRYEEALASLDKAIELDPTDTIPWILRGFVLSKLKRCKGALTSFDKAIELDPNDAWVWADRGRSLNQLKRYEEALTSFDKAIELDPNDAQDWADRGWSLNQLKRHKEALASYNKAIELDPNDAWAWTNRSLTLDKLKRDVEALVSYNKAIELNPNDARAWANRGLTLGKLKRDEEALVSYNKAIELNPNGAWAWSNRGVALARLKRDEEALVSYNKAIELNPNSVRAWVNRGLTLGKLKRDEEALLSYNKAIELDPNYAQWGWMIGSDILDNLKDYKEALAAYDKAIELGFQSSNVFFYRAIALLGLNQWDEGIAALDNAFQRLEPDEQAYADDVKLVLVHQLENIGDPTTWQKHLTTLLELYHKHQAAPILGQGLVRTIPALLSETVSDKTAQTWRSTWQQLAGKRPDFEIPLRLLKTAVEYKQKKGDPRVLLTLPLEERNLLRELLVVSG